MYKTGILAVNTIFKSLFQVKTGSTGSTNKHVLRHLHSVPFDQLHSIFLFLNARTCSVRAAPNSFQTRVMYCVSMYNRCANSNQQDHKVEMKCFAVVKVFHKHVLLSVPKYQANLLQLMNHLSCKPICCDSADSVGPKIHLITPRLHQVIWLHYKTVSKRM